MSEQPLDVTAAQVAKALRWAGFLVAVSLVILLIDMQLKRSIARQAVSAAGLIDRALGIARKGAARGPEAAGAGRDDHHGGATGRADVVADAGVAAGDDHQGNASPVVEGAAPAGPRKRAAGDGRRASRPESGS